MPNAIKGVALNQIKICRTTRANTFLIWLINNSCSTGLFDFLGVVHKCCHTKMVKMQCDMYRESHLYAILRVSNSLPPLKV